eukprot:CAMPEP_0174901510 /NCGR_PEP_ID=MMETSP0167-20121228/34777_2 /TAXON_ID=38298 /ORGANISM="Rhodella maculata, Strain CCMP736" /LENGTH=90 /DNA_ID=CAMNT_0016143199 /DNA_START=559 /DNA_END=831 /DNA_ORIENTATION=-
MGITKAKTPTSKTIPIKLSGECLRSIVLHSTLPNIDQTIKVAKISPCEIECCTASTPPPTADSTPIATSAACATSTSSATPSTPVATLSA